MAAFVSDPLGDVERFEAVREALRHATSPPVPLTRRERRKARKLRRRWRPRGT
jgi:hypothetical protein